MEHRLNSPPTAALSPVSTDLVSNQSAEGLLEDCDLFGPARDDVLAMAVKMANVLDEPGQDLEADFPKSEGSPRGGWGRQEWARRAADVSSPSLGGDPRLGSPPPCVRTLSGWHLPGVEGRRGWGLACRQDGVSCVPPQTPWTSIPAWTFSSTAAWSPLRTLLQIPTCLARFARWAPAGMAPERGLARQELDGLSKPHPCVNLGLGGSWLRKGPAGPRRSTFYAGFIKELRIKCC